MQLKSTLTGLGILLGAAFNAHATLTSYSGSDGAGLVYSSVSNIIWTQDANLLGTLESTLGHDNVINAIIAASPTIYDTANVYDNPSNSGYHSVIASDFSAGGRANWFGALAFTTYLNSINYGGSSQWRLPTSNAIQAFDGSAGNELGQLFYDELGGAANFPIPDTTRFDNEQAYAYWTGTEYLLSPSPGPASAWTLFSHYGGQGTLGKNGRIYAWAVTPGSVTAVPVPAAIWLFGSGLLGLAGLKRRGHAG